MLDSGLSSLCFPHLSLLERCDRALGEEKCSSHGNSDVDVAAPEQDREQGNLDLDSFPPEVKGQILKHFRYEQLYPLQLLSKGWRSLIRSDGFLRSLALKDQPSLTACYFYIKHGVWQWAGFDPNLRSSSNTTGAWRRLPSLSFLPSNCAPDADLFKQFLMCTSHGRVLMNFSKSPHEELLIIFNPLTQQTKELPPLLHRRNPVLLHLLTDPSTNSYLILAAGSSESGEEQLSKITETYDSRTNCWERVGDLPGLPFSLNEYQHGVLYRGNIFCIGFVTNHGEIVKGILEYNVAERRWDSKWTERSLLDSTILQLVVNSGELYLFSERETGRVIEHVVDRIVWDLKDGASFKLDTVVVVVKKSGSKSLEVYPEFALVPFSRWKLCIYNTVDHTGHVFDVQDPEQWEALPVLPEEGFKGELGLFTLNPMSFAVEPRFSSVV